MGNLSEEKINMLVEWLIELVGAEDVVDVLPASLSTGRKRAVAMARALAAQPEVVLYDEPTTMVDPIIARRLGDLIQRAKDRLGFTSIVVTHDMRFAERLADTGALPPPGPRPVLWSAQGVYGIPRSQYSAVSYPGRIHITYGMNYSSFGNHQLSRFSLLLADRVELHSYSFHHRGIT